MNLNQIRSQVPIVREMAYFDMAFGYPLPTCVRRTIASYLSSIQTKGVKKTEYLVKVEEVRKKAATLLGARASEIAFVKNTSEGLNIAANGIRYQPGDNVVLNELEHLNNVFCWLRLREKGVEVRIAPQRNGRVDINDILSLIDSRTRAVAVASVTNDGFRFDLQRLGRKCHENSAFLVVDAIQTLGGEPTDVKKLGIDMLSASCHKGLLGPHGIGLFYCSDNIINDIVPPYVARTSYSDVQDPKSSELQHSAVKFEYGNYNYLGIYALASGLEFLAKVDVAKISPRTFELAENFRNGLKSIGVNLLDSPHINERTHIVSFAVPGRSVDDMVAKLDKRRIRVSGHYGKVRASFGLYNNLTEVNKTLKTVKALAKA